MRLYGILVSTTVTLTMLWQSTVAVTHYGTTGYGPHYDAAGLGLVLSATIGTLVAHGWMLKTGGDGK